MKRWTLGLIAPVAAVMAWDAAVRLSLIPHSQAASPSDVIVTLGHLLSTGTLFLHAGYSLARLICGVVIGSVLAVAFALTVTVSARTSALLSPTVHVSSGVPVVLWMPFCVMFFGVGEMYKVSLLVIATFFLVQGFVVQSLDLTHRQFIELAEVYEKSRSVQVRHLFIPSALPAILSAVRAAFALGWVILFFVEFATSESGREGLGWFIADARHSGRLEEEFASLVWLAILAFLVDVVLARFQTHKLKWLDLSASSVSVSSHMP